jgi:hypothetical protein
MEREDAVDIFTPDNTGLPDMLNNRGIDPLFAEPFQRPRVPDHYKIIRRHRHTPKVCI